MLIKETALGGFLVGEAALGREVFCVDDMGKLVRGCDDLIGGMAFCTSKMRASRRHMTHINQLTMRCGGEDIGCCKEDRRDGPIAVKLLPRDRFDSSTDGTILEDEPEDVDA